jgi:membrane protease YdiL (CAAX protease family)
MRRLLVPSDGSRGLVATLGLVALTPAICEEALFRGPILRGLCSQLGPVTAVAMTGLLFGIFHLDFARVLPASLLGVLLSLIALRSGSILPAMLAHFLNNSILVVLAYYRLDQRLENVSGVWAVAALALSLAVTAAGVALLQSAKRTARM